MTYFINFLTLSRIFLAAVIFLLLTRPEGYFLAFILFFIAGATDYFDGYLARKYPSGLVNNKKITTARKILERVRRFIKYVINLILF